MTQQLMTIDEARKYGAEEWILQKAAAAGKQVLMVRWDKADGWDTNHPAYGFVQWSVRPYTLGDGCDGTVSGAVHLLAMNMLEQLGLSYAHLYRDAYPTSPAWEPTQAERAELVNWIEAFPTVDDETLRKLLSSLGAINNSTFLYYIVSNVKPLGYDVEDWWVREEDRA